MPSATSYVNNIGCLPCVESDVPLLVAEAREVLDELGVDMFMETRFLDGQCLHWIWKRDEMNRLTLWPFSPDLGVTDCESIGRWL
jgi:hypothetical protein